MTGIKFLEELVKENNIDSISKEYGLKVEGLVKLKKIVNESKELKYVIIPDLFTIDESVSLNDPNLEKAYIKYTSQFNKPKIILARSSDPLEVPGKFETASSLYIPENPKQSFDNWITAVKKVKESGARAIIGQEMVGDLEEFKYDYEYVKIDNNDYEKKDIRIKSFGGNMTSFFMNSTNFINGNNPSIVACFGLASKIARGDRDVSLIQESVSGVKIINLNHVYENDSFAYYNQRNIDIITLENPSKISAIKYNEEFQGDKTVIDRSVVPFGRYYDFKILAENDEYNNSFSVSELFDILNVIERKTNTNIEVEGCINDDGIHLFQLREYELPTKSFHHLTKTINKDKKFSEIINGIGFNQFTGDIYISEKTIDVPENAILYYTGKIHSEDNFNKFKKYKQMIIPIYDSTGLYQASHSFGRTVQTMVELEKLGIKSIALNKNYNPITIIHNNNKNAKLLNTETNDILLKNMTVECDGVNAQIYYND